MRKIFFEIFFVEKKSDEKRGVEKDKHSKKQVAVDQEKVVENGDSHSKKQVLLSFYPFNQYQFDFVEMYENGKKDTSSMNWMSWTRLLWHCCKNLFGLIMLW